MKCVTHVGYMLVEARFGRKLKIHSRTLEFAPRKAPYKHSCLRPELSLQRTALASIFDMYLDAFPCRLLVYFV